MEQNYYLTSQKTFLMALSLTWAEVAIKILSSGEISAIFQTLGKVIAIVRNLRGGFCNYPFHILHKYISLKMSGIYISGLHPMWHLDP